LRSSETDWSTRWSGGQPFKTDDSLKLTLLGWNGVVKFNFEDPKRQELKGNTTSAELSGPGLLSRLGS
jgi:hypothetical protein